MSESTKNVTDDIFKEIKVLEDKKQELNNHINEINDFSNKLKSKLTEEDIALQAKVYDTNIEKEKLKNDNDINILSQDNDKYEKYIQLLSKKYELELQYIEQYCEYKSKIEKIGEKYVHIDIKNITSLQDLFMNHLNKNFVPEKTKKEIKENKEVSKKLQEQLATEPSSNNAPAPAQRRNTIATVVENPNKNDIRNDGSLQDHLKQALSAKFTNIRNE